MNVSLVGLVVQHLTLLIRVHVHLVTKRS
jgi:hypothetical protein